MKSWSQQLNKFVYFHLFTFLLAETEFIHVKPMRYSPLLNSH